MKTIGGSHYTAKFFLLLSLLLFPALSRAAVMNDYCVTPSFISQSITPNLLLMIDNSSSMGDLAYADKGAKRCSTSTSTLCTKDAECPPGETCAGALVRQPFYCYDKTYRNANTYVGYFDSNSFYYYRTGTDDFAKLPTGSNFPYTCTAEAGNTIKSIANTMCLKYTDSKAFVSFVAKGNYLNWLAASKFDVEKQILTGGKYDGASLIAESRGCVGREYVKDAITSNFVNYVTEASSTNEPLEVTFTVHGPANPYSASAPSPGGQTFIDIYAGAAYNSAACQNAIDAIASGDNADIKQKVEACLNASVTVSGYCQQDSLRACTTSYPDCDPPVVPAHCSGNASRSCTTDPDCYVTGAKVCNGTQTLCTADSECDRPAIYACQQDLTKSCAAASDCVIPAVLGTCRQKGSWSCLTDADCGPKGPCDGEQPSSDKGPCVVKTAAVIGSCESSPDVDLRPCLPQTGGYVGPCSLPSGAAATKTKISFQQSMQACWQLREGNAIGNDDINTVKNQCSDIYGSFATCSNNHLLTCDPAVVNSCGAGNTCQTGPLAIASGNPGLLCGVTYEGQFYEPTGSNGAWVLKPTATTADMIAVHTQFCTDMLVTNVTDPTDAPSNTSTADNLPAILSGVGVQAQMGTPIRTMRVKVATPTAPTGRIQYFKDQIRFGVMSFDNYGSASEVGLMACSNDFTRECDTLGAACPAVNGVSGKCVKMMPTPSFCSNDPSVPCAHATDCGGSACSPTTAGTSNLDGGRILPNAAGGAYIGLGHCSTTTSITCTNDNFCPAGETCMSNGVGDYSTGLIQSINNNILATTWTPFAEAFYNAIGYFAKKAAGKCSVSNAACTTTADCASPAGQTCNYAPQKYCATSGTACATAADCDVGAGEGCIFISRIDMRLNSGDFNAKYNPSNYSCQSNNILLITDGMSTADRKDSVDNLAGLYTNAGGSHGWTSVCGGSGSPPYGGSVNLDNMAWIANHVPISSFSKTAQTTAAPTMNSDFITSYVVLNGDSNGLSGECDSKTLLQQTATNGGTTLLQATEPAALQDAINTALEGVAGRSASGTAASILSNSAGSGANILQALFYPLQEFGGTTKVKWIGEMLNLWYYIDPFIQSSTLREDTGYTSGDHTLNLKDNYILTFKFDDTVGDANYNKTVVRKIRDVNGDGSVLTNVTGWVLPDDAQAIWRAGAQLQATSADDRRIYTPCLTASACLTINGNDTNQMAFTTANADTLQPYLQAAASPSTEASAFINWVRGWDAPTTPSSFRQRTVTYTYNGVTTTDSWKLGDIISSTPRTQSSVKLNSYDLSPPAGYKDPSYGAFLNGAYTHRGMAYVGANDGMLHAFKLGKLNVTSSGALKATLTGTDLGEEQWAFIPTNALPYLRYLTCKDSAGDAAYCENHDYGHLYYVDGSTTVVDASIGHKTTSPACDSSTPYWKCAKDDTSGTNWKTVLIGGMGIGGASRAPDASCTEDTAGTCVKAPVTGKGHSSYFALDVTNQTYNSSGVLADALGNSHRPPKFMWEFSDAAISDTESANRGLGFATTGAAIVRVNSRDGSDGISGASVPAINNNGKWFAVFGSGPTGPINKTTHQFLGKSDQKLKIYIVDLNASGAWLSDGTSNSNYWVIDHLGDDATEQIPNAFVSSISSAPIDTERWNRELGGNYQDNVLYFGYSQANSNPLTASTTWTNGGILRLVTNEDPNPAHWKLSTVIELDEPVTTGIAKLQDRKNHNLWLYWGTGRYFYNGDDMTLGRHLYGLKEPCYPNTAADSLTMSCTTQVSNTTCSLPLQTNCITDRTTVDDTAVPRGWSIALDGNSGTSGAERVITDPVAMSNGAVFFSTYKPTSDLCANGGNAYLWALKYDTGSVPPDAALKGKVLFQLSTGEFKQVSLSDPTTFTDKDHRRTGSNWTGKPPSDPPPIISNSNLKPVKKIIHIQEK